MHHIITKHVTLNYITSRMVSLHNFTKRTWRVLCDVSDGPGRRLFHRGVELLQARHQGAQRIGIYHGLGEVRGVLCHGA